MDRHVLVEYNGELPTESVIEKMMESAKKMEQFNNTIGRFSCSAQNFMETAGLGKGNGKRRA